MPEKTSLARATTFNQKNVTDLHRNYGKLLVKFKFSSQQIYTLDETGVTTVFQAPHIVAQRGIEQVEHVVSAENGQLITVCAITNATGNTVPAVFVFCYARMHDA
jgi:hypothetical protein